MGSPSIMDAADHELHCFNLIVQIDAVSHTNPTHSTLLLRLRSEVDNVRFPPKTDSDCKKGAGFPRRPLFLGNVWAF